MSSNKKTSTSSKRKNNSSQEDIAESANSSTITSSSVDTRRTVKRLMDLSSIYVKCDVICYDEKLHKSVDQAIEQLEVLEQDFDTTPDDLLGDITERHLDLLNQRMKLLKFRPDDYVDTISVGNSGVSRSRSRNPIVTDELNLETQCVFCKADHVSEKCTNFPLNRRSNIIKRRKRCYKCLAKFYKDSHNCDAKCRHCDRGHHASLCKRLADGLPPKVSTTNKSAKSSSESSFKSAASTSNARVKPPIKEPALPDPSDPMLTVPRNINHPRSLGMSPLVYADYKDHYSFMPTVTVCASSSNKKALGRTLINYSMGSSCFASAAFVQKLGLKPIKLNRPLPVGPMKEITTDSYVILEISSLYREEYHFKQVFYIVDCMSHYKVDIPTPQIRKLAEEKGVTLSNDYDKDASHRDLELFIGMQMVKLTGLDTMQRIDLNSTEHGIRTHAHYTHFGYMLLGEQNKSIQEPSSSSKNTASGSGNTGGPSGGRSGVNTRQSKRKAR